MKFPLGLWHQAESRLFNVSCNDNAVQRKIQVTIEDLDFSYQGVPHSLSFHWQVLNETGNATDVHYTYSPGAGMVAEYGDE